MSPFTPTAHPLRYFVAGAALWLLAAFAHATALFSDAEGSLSAARPDSERYAKVRLDARALEQLDSGATLTVTVPDVDRFEYVVQRRSRGEGLTLIEATLRDTVTKRLTLGVRGRNVAAYIDTPAGAFVLGYVNHTHWLGVAGQDYAAEPDNTVAVLSERRIDSSPSPTRKTAQPPVPEAQPVEVNIAGLTGLDSGAEAKLTLPRMGEVSVVYEQTLNDSGTPTWVGYLRDYGKDFRVVLSFAPTGTQGRILAPSGEYLVMPGTEGDWLVDVQVSGLVEPHSEGCAQGEFAGGDGTAGATATTGPAAPVSTVGAADATTDTVVDLLVLYTQDLVERLGSVAAVTARIDYLVSVANLAYGDGTIPMRVRVVHSAPVTVPIASTNSTVLGQLRAGSAPFTTVPALRAQYGADLVTVLRPFRKTEQQGVCGVGYVGGYNGSDIANYAGQGFSVVADGTDMAGSGYYCQDYTFVHELGHNMGLMHDRATVASQGGGMGAYPYAYGYGQSGVFGTIMSYIQPRRGRFSNPLDTSCAGQPCGVPASVVASAADNAQALWLTRTKVAAFQPTLVGSPSLLTVTGAVTVNSVARAGVAISSTNTQASCTATGTTGVFQCTMPPGTSTTLTPVLAGVSFTPANRAVTAIAGNLSGYNFSGQSVRYTVTGTVTVNGAVRSGVTISSSNTQASCTASGTTGMYQCTIPAGTSTTLRPVLAGVSFTPASRAVTAIAGNLSGYSFSGQPTRYTVGGRITYNGAALANVRLTPSVTTVSCSTTSSSGTYSCSALHGSSFTLTPVANTTGIRFNPVRASVTNLQANLATLNFTAYR